VPKARARGCETRSAQFANTSPSAAQIRRSCSVLQRRCFKGGASKAVRQRRPLEAIGTKKIHRAGCAFVHDPRERSAFAYCPREPLRPTRAPCSVQGQPNPPTGPKTRPARAKSAHFAHSKLSTFPRSLRAPGEKSVDIPAGAAPPARRACAPRVRAYSEGTGLKARVTLGPNRHAAGACSRFSLSFP
jgi:hypothetical protein